MDDPKRQFYILGAIAAVVAGIYLAGEVFGEPQDANADPNDPNASARAEREPETPTPGSDQMPGIAGTPLAAPSFDPGVRTARNDARRLYTIDTELVRATFSDHGGGLVSVELKNAQFKEDDGSLLQLVTTDKERYQPFRIEVTGADIPPDAVWQGEQLSENAIRLTWEGNGMRVRRRIEAGGPYQLWSTVEVRNLDDEPRYARIRYFTHHYVAKDDEEGGFIAAPSTRMSHGVCRHAVDGEGETEREAGETLATDVMGWPRPEFVGIHDTYFANVLVADGAERCVLAAQRRPTPEDYVGTLFQAELRYPAATLEPNATVQERTMQYLGPTDRAALLSAGHGLSEVIDLGWFSFIANGLNDLLRLLFSFIGSWGLAIIVLTLMVKTVFYPLTVKSFRSMAAMRKLKPKIDAINEKYGDDREKKGAATMELYRKEKINPAAGCLPSLLQMPVWFALYRSLSTNLELYRAPFLVWDDLSAPDPFFALPILVAVLMHFQQRLTPSTINPKQAKIFMYFMPIMFGSFMLFLPAGLCVYIVTNSTLTILQQRYIYAKLDREEAAGESQPTTVDEDPEPEEEAVEDATSASSTRRRLPASAKKRRRRGRA